MFSLSLFADLPLAVCVTAVPSQGGEGTEGRKKGENESGAEEGGMGFTDGPPGFTHSSGAVHPVLSSPPPPELTHHAARTHASLATKHIPPPPQCPLFLQHTL